MHRKSHRAAGSSPKAKAAKSVRFARVKNSSEIRTALKMKKASGYKIHKLLAAPAGC